MSNKNILQPLHPTLPTNNAKMVQSLIPPEVLKRQQEAVEAAKKKKEEQLKKAQEQQLTQKQASENQMTENLLRSMIKKGAPSLTPQRSK